MSAIKKRLRTLLRGLLLRPFARSSRSFSSDRIECCRSGPWCSCRFVAGSWWDRSEVVVMDGSPLLNMAAWVALYRPDAFDEATCEKALCFFSAVGESLPKNDPLFAAFPELVMLRRLGFDRLELPNGALFLDIDAGDACRRISERGQARQVHETEEKLARLREAYRCVLRVAERTRGVTVRKVDAGRPPEEVAGAVLRGVREVLENGTENDAAGDSNGASH